MRFLRIAFMLGVLGGVSGCAAVALTAAGLVGGAGLDHTLSGISYKTFSTPMNNLRLATLKTLKRLEIDVADDKKSEGGWEIAATATDRTISIELERLTDKVTRMRVVVDQGSGFLKDSATGTEIIIQTAETLNQMADAS